MAHLVWTIGLYLLLTSDGQAQSIPYRFWAGDIPPYSYLDQENKPTGDMYRVFQALVERMGFKARVEIVPLKRILMESQKNHPILFMPVARSPKRESLYQWIEPLTVESFGVFGLASRASSIQDTAGLKNLRICILRGSATEEIAKRHHLERLEIVGTNDTCARLLRAGRVDAWLAAKRAAQASYVQVGYDVKELVAGVQLELWPLYLAAWKGMPEADLLLWRSTLQKMKSDGSFDRLLN